MTTTELCFACGRPIKGHMPFTIVTEDGAQHPYVGPDCFKHIQKAGRAGYAAPLGGPRLFTIAHFESLS